MLLGDVGGFTGFLVYLSSVMLSIFTYENSTDYITKSLYKGENGEELDRKPFPSFQGIPTIMSTILLLDKQVPTAQRKRQGIDRGSKESDKGNGSRQNNSANENI